MIFLYDHKLNYIACLRTPSENTCSNENRKIKTIICNDSVGFSFTSKDH